MGRVARIVRPIVLSAFISVQPRFHRLASIIISSVLSAACAKSVVSIHCSAPPRLRVRFLLSRSQHCIYATKSPQSPPHPTLVLRRISRFTPNIASKTCPKRCEKVGTWPAGVGTLPGRVQSGRAFFSLSPHLPRSPACSLSPNVPRTNYRSRRPSRGGRLWLVFLHAPHHSNRTRRTGLSHSQPRSIRCRAIGRCPDARAGWRR